MAHHSVGIKGFTLVELLIAVAIVAILTAVALPNYQDSVRKSRRADAQQLMLSIANREELYLADALSYTDAFTTLNFSSDQWTCTAAACTNSFYSVVVVLDAGPPPGYTIRATPTAASQTADGVLTLTGAGVKTRNGVTGW